MFFTTCLGCSLNLAHSLHVHALKRSKYCSIYKVPLGITDLYAWKCSWERYSSFSTNYLFIVHYWLSRLIFLSSINNVPSSLQSSLENVLMMKTVDFRKSEMLCNNILIWYFYTQTNAKASMCILHVWRKTAFGSLQISALFFNVDFMVQANMKCILICSWNNSKNDLARRFCCHR